MLTWISLLTFWFSLLALFYTYLGYPLIVALLVKIRKQQPTVDKKTIYPHVTIIIAAYNEEDCIATTLENKISLDYPNEKLQIIVISDESEDQTDSIVESFTDRGVTLLRQSPRAGKTSALNLAVPHARGEIIVFSDANSIYAPDAIQHLVANFADKDVGYVTGKMIYTNSDGTTIGDGCSAYMKYENWLREIETSLGSIVGVDGGIDAMRKELYSQLNTDQLPDFVQPLKVVKKGFRVVYEPAALLREASLQESLDEYRMRVRVTLRAFWALKDMHSLLWGTAGYLFAWQLWSHKMLRYFCFIFLLGAYGANIFILREMSFYRVTLILQTACYAGAFASPLLARKNIKFKLFYFCHYFVLLNVAAGHAFVKFAMGKKKIIWKPRKG